MESVQDGNEAVFEKLEILTDEISLPSFHLYPLSVSVFASIPYLSLFSSLSPICLCFRLSPLSISVFFDHRFNVAWKPDVFRFSLRSECSELANRWLHNSTQVNSLTSQVTDLETTLQFVTLVDKNMYFTGVNIHIRNGLETTESIDGTGIPLYPEMFL